MKQPDKKEIAMQLAGALVISAVLLLVLAASGYV